MKALCCSLALLCAAQFAHGQGPLSFVWKKLAMGDATAIAVSPDDKEVAITADNDVICFFDSVTGKFLRSLPGQRYINKLDYSPDGKFFALCRSYDTVSIANAQTGEVRWTSSYAQAVSFASFSADSQLIGGGGRGQANLWRVSDGALLWGVKDPLITMADLSPDGKRMAVYRKNSSPSVQIWDIASNAVVDEFGSGANAEAYPRHSHDGKMLALGTPGVGTTVWRLSDHAILLFSPIVGWGNPSKCTFSLDDRLLAESSGSQVKIWDIASGVKVDEIDQGGNFVQFSGTADSLFLPSGTAFRYDFATKKSTPYKGEAPVDAEVVFAANGKTMTVDRELWNAETGERIATLDLVSEPFVASPTENIFACRSISSQQFSLIDSDTGQILKTFQLEQSQGHTFSLQKAAFSKDGKILVLVLTYPGSYGRIELWDAENWVKIRDFWTDSFTYRIAIDPHNRWIATNAADTVTVFDLLTGEIKYELKERYNPDIRQIAFLHDGKELGVSVDTKQQMRIVRCSDWTELAPIPYPFQIDYRFNSLFKGSVGVGGTILSDLRFIDMSNGNVLAQYPMPSRLQYVATSKDASRIAISSGPLFGVFKNPLPYMTKSAP